MPPSPTRVAVPAALTAVLLALTTACGDPGPGAATDPPPAVDELAAADGHPCPDRLPGTGDDAFGSTDPADGPPELTGPDRAWVCTYSLRSGPGAGARGPAWIREARPEQVATDRLPALADALAGLAPADADRACTEEMGPRHLLVLAADGAVGTDLTGVVVDGYGCRDVRLTDEPSTTPPGAASAPGVVPGVLRAPDGLVEALAPGGLVRE